MIPRLYLYAGAVAFLVVLLSVSHCKAYNAGERAAHAENAEASRKAQAEADRKQAEYLKSSKSLAEKLARVLARPAEVRYETRTLVKEVPANAATRTCPDLSDGFLHEYNLAASDPTSTPAALPTAPVSTSLQTPSLVLESHPGR